MLTGGGKPPSPETHFAEWLMYMAGNIYRSLLVCPSVGWSADRHATNGRLTVTELATFLPDHPFTKWFLKDRVTLLRCLP